MFEARGTVPHQLIAAFAIEFRGFAFGGPPILVIYLSSVFLGLGEQRFHVPTGPLRPGSMFRPVLSGRAPCSNRLGDFPIFQRSRVLCRKTRIFIGFAPSESMLLVAGPPRRGTGAWRSAGPPLETISWQPKCAKGPPWGGANCAA